ncbi:hypothetical protein [Neptunicella sp. SCSIO 80796]|uniref:hypothetical protein n=1 Tax=Neptunicella plasticusilytica TaxID=3117012 RepID=UPI003A4D323C
MFKKLLPPKSVQALSDQFTNELDQIIEREQSKAEIARDKANMYKSHELSAMAEASRAHRAKGKLAALFS